MSCLQYEHEWLVRYACVWKSGWMVVGTMGQETLFYAVVPSSRGVN